MGRFSGAWLNACIPPMASLQIQRVDAHGDHERSTFNAQRSTLNAQRSTLNVQRSTFNAQRSTLNVQRSTFNVQRSTLNAQRSTFNVQRSTFNAQRSTFNVQPRRSTEDGGRTHWCTGWSARPAALAPPGAVCVVGRGGLAEPTGSSKQRGQSGCGSAGGARPTWWCLVLGSGRII